MIDQIAVPARSSAQVHRAKDASVLQRITEPGVNLCLWERTPVPAADFAIRAILRAKIPLNIDLHAPDTERLSAEITAFLPAAALARSIHCLAEDVIFLAGHFTELTAIRHVRLRLNRVDDDGCALFHADSLSLRLLCLYAGPGTQWLENDNVRRDELGTHSRTLDEANDAIVIDPANIRSIEAWHVAVFSGRARESTPALVHRSAPVSHPKDFRLRLCIDLPSDCGW